MCIYMRMTKRTQVTPGKVEPRASSNTNYENRTEPREAEPAKWSSAKQNRDAFPNSVFELQLGKQGPQNRTCGPQNRPCGLQNIFKNENIYKQQLYKQLYKNIYKKYVKNI